MAPTFTTFGYQAAIPLSGYRWASVKEMRAREILDPDGRPSGGGPFLVDDPEDDRRLVYPTRERPTLFREFADLDPQDLGALAAFASANGLLDPERTWRICCRPGGAVKGLLDDEVSGEAHSRWADSIILLRLAVTIWDLINRGDVAGVRHHLSWQPSGLSGPGLPSHAWRIELGRFSLVVWPWGSFEASEKDDPLLVATSWLIREVNRQIHGAVSPELQIVDGNVAEHLVPRSLVAAVWSQVYLAIVGQKSYEKCKACGRWFEVVNKSATDKTSRRVFCGNVCRVRAYRERIGRALALAKRGKTAKEIATELDSDLATVKAWLKKGG